MTVKKELRRLHNDLAVAEEVREEAFHVLSRIVRVSKDHIAQAIAATVILHHSEERISRLQLQINQKERS